MRCCPYCNSEVTREGLVMALAKTLSPTERRIVEFVWEKGPVNLFSIAEEIYGSGPAKRGEADIAAKHHIYRVRAKIRRHGLDLKNITPPGPSMAEYVIEDLD